MPTKAASEGGNIAAIIDAAQEPRPPSLCGEPGDTERMFPEAIAAASAIRSSSV
jgi:hypothetical protein